MAVIRLEISAERFTPSLLTEKVTHKLRTLKNQPPVEEQRAQLKGELMIHIKERVKLAKQLTVRAV